MARRRKSHSIEPLEARIAPAFSAVVTLSSLAGTDGFRVNGAGAGDQLGASVSYAGDVNGDGIEDLLIGATFADDGLNNSGAAYVVFGKTTAFNGAFNISTLNGANGFRITGILHNDVTGGSVSGVGDVNGDGFDDILIGAYRANGASYGDSAGAAYVVYGKAAPFAASLPLSDLNGGNGFKINGENVNDGVGTSVDAAGDVNGDGVSDMIIGTYTSSPNGSNSGASYVVFGNSNGFAPTLDLSNLNGANGFQLNGIAAGDRAGVSVSAGDVNGDGRGDLIVGAFGAPGGTSFGETYVVFGSTMPFSSEVELSSLAGGNGFKIVGPMSGDQAGFSAGVAGDVNNDGFDDIIIGSAVSDANGPNSGSAFVVFGKATGFGASFALTDLNGANGFRMNGETALSFAGFAVSKAGDVNNDTFDDVLIGSPSPTQSTAAYVVYGKASGFSANIELSALNGANGFKLVGMAGEEGGTSVSFAGDINDDGIDDIVVGALGANAPGSDSGSAFVVFGQAGGGGGGGSVNISISDAIVQERATPLAKATFTVTLDSPSTQVVTVFYSTSDGNANAVGDYVPATPTVVTFAPGQTSKTVSVGIVNDNFREDTESFFVLLSGAVNGVIDDGSAEATILDDDVPVEKATSVVFRDVDGDQVTISLTGAKLQAGDITFASDGSIAEIDLTRFAPGGPNAALKPLNLTIGVKTPKGGPGDGLVQIGLLNATGVDLGTVKVFGNVERILGGDDDLTRAALKSLTISGSLGPLLPGEEAAATELIGNVGTFTVKGGVRNASIEITGAAGTIKIGGDLLGEVGMDMAAVQEFMATGQVPRVGGGLPFGAVVAGSMKSFSVGGSLQGGAVTSSGDVGNVKVSGDMSNSSLVSGGVVRVVKLFGKLVSDPDAPTIITALAKLSPDKSSRAAGINALTVKGDVENARILVGYNVMGEGINPDASIGKVSVGGNWKASSLAAGVLDVGTDGFGLNDTVIPESPADTILARITSIVINGTATGSTAVGDHFGIVAEQIGSLKINRIKVPLLKNVADNILIDDDFSIVEVVRPVV